LKPVGKEKVLLSRVESAARKKRTEEDRFTKLLDTEPRRTGKPENPSPEEIKSIWNE
jgi:hypothetical protein